MSKTRGTVHGRTPLKDSIKGITLSKAGREGSLQCYAATGHSLQAVDTGVGWYSYRKGVMAGRVPEGGIPPSRLPLGSPPPPDSVAPNASSSLPQQILDICEALNAD